MDLHLYLRVLWRFRIIVLAGILLATALAFLSHVRVSFEEGGPTLSYRESEVWQAQGRLLVTEPGFPVGYRLPHLEKVPGDSAVDGEAGGGVPRFAEPGRFGQLAVQYSNLATSDAVRAIMLEAGPINGAVQTGVGDREGVGVLPYVHVMGIADSPARAVSVSERAMEALQTYKRRQERANKIPSEQRVLLEVVRQPGNDLQLLTERKITRPVFLFLTVLIATLGLVFVLENLRPRIRAVPAEEPSLGVTDDVRRRSA